MKKSLLLGLAVVLLLCMLPATAQFRTSYATQGQQQQSSGRKQAAPINYGGATVYPQYRSKFGSIRWIREQMPLKVYVSHGQAVDGFIDESLGAPIANVNNLDHWPDLVAEVISNPEQMQNLPTAQGYTEDLYTAAVQGILSWKGFEKEGLLSYTLTNDPSEADIHVFWVHHFVDKMALGLFAGDIRGYTAKRSFPYKAIMAGGKADFKPVVIMLRTTESNGATMPLGKMKAAAAHEFGHALGIEGHSQNPVDLMSLYYGRGAVSANDAATLRYLYRTTPDLIP
jgi:predicted Zn-dependent protease